MSLLPEGHKLYYRQMVTQLRVNKEMCLSQLFSHFVHPLFNRSTPNTILDQAALAL